MKLGTVIFLVRALEWLWLARNFAGWRLQAGQRARRCLEVWHRETNLCRPHEEVRA